MARVAMISPKKAILSLILTVTVIYGFPIQTIFGANPGNDCCLISAPQHFSSVLKPTTGNTGHLIGNSIGRVVGEHLNLQSQNLFNTVDTPSLSSTGSSNNAFVVRNSRNVAVPNNFYNFNGYTGAASVGNIGIDTEQSYGGFNNGNAGQYGSSSSNSFNFPEQQQQQQSGYAQTVNYGSGAATNFDANSWAQANANLFQQQQQQQLQQAGGYGGYSQQSGYSPQSAVNQGYGGQNSYGPVQPQPQAQAQIQIQQQAVNSQNGGYGLPQQIVQTYYPFNGVDQQPQQQGYPQTQTVDHFSQQQQQIVDQYNQQQQQQQSSYVETQPQPQPQPQQQQINYGSYPQPQIQPQPQPQPQIQAPGPIPEAEQLQPESAQTSIDMSQLQQYAQYLEMIQKQYGIKLPPPPTVPKAQPDYGSSNQQQQQQNQNPYAAAVQPQTQTHIQATLNPSVQGRYTVAAGETPNNNFNPWQTGYNSNYNLNLQLPSQPASSVNPQDPVYQVPQINYPHEQQQQQGVHQSVHQGVQQGVQQGVHQGVQQGVHQGVHQGVQQGVHQPIQQQVVEQQPYYPDYSNVNTVIDQQQPQSQPQPAPHIIIPEPRQPAPVQVHIPRPPKPQPQPVYIPPTQATTMAPTRPPPPPQTRPTFPPQTIQYEREIVTRPPPPPPTPLSPSKPASTTSIQALTQQIRKLPAVLYVDSKNPDTKRTETLLRETYGLPLVAFYVDKIDKPKAVERHLQQLTAHKGMPYLFICGTFIGSQQHIDNYHTNKQIPQLVEYVCGDEKKHRTQKKKSTT